MPIDKETVDLTHTKEEGTSQEILKVLKSFRTEFRGEIQEFRNEMRGEVQALKVQNDKIIKKTSLLEKNIKEVDEKYQHLPEEVEVLKSKVSHFEQKELVNDILITGLPVNQAKPLLETVVNYLNILDTELISTQIEFVYRFKRNNQTSSSNNITSSPVIVRFTSYKSKQNLLQQQKRVGPVLQNQVGGDVPTSNTGKIIIQQRLTPSNFKLLQKARQVKLDLGFKFVWISDSYNIYLQKDENTEKIRVTSLNQLNQLSPTASGSDK